MSSDASVVVPCAGAIIFDEDERLLVIQRGRPPDAGRWSVPGGRCLPAEPPDAACVREVHEETGLTVSVLRHAGRVVRPGAAGASYRIDDYVCQVLGGSLAAADDAADVRWVTREQLDQLPITPGLREALSDWGLLPR